MEADPKKAHELNRFKVNLVKCLKCHSVQKVLNLYLLTFYISPIKNALNAGKSLESTFAQYAICLTLTQAKNNSIVIFAVFADKGVKRTLPTVSLASVAFLMLLLAITSALTMQ